ncbi:TIGR02186 family protein [Vannielia sp.]|uniref:TIGR02186 family protein n=1 Tax=Vannielia sp. TaxID=2813045 RepID=UPI0026244354|nr:TIGR02186 family protein [Vannielia sp.]MDF1872715.1 TIGR02186 family protein [Vannielia sp.]
MRGAFALIGLVLLAFPAMAQEGVVADLSQSRVGITATFDGSEILVFGAVKDAKSEAPLGVIISVSGPAEPIMVRKKARKAGVWVNSEAVKVAAAPSFYHVVTTHPLEDMLTPAQDARYALSIPKAIRAGAENTAEFTEALIRIREESGLYAVHTGEVTLKENTLFRAHIALPANLTEGSYLTRIFLTRDGRVVARQATTIHVSKVGLERWIYALAHERPFIYGVLSLAIAIAAGWGASAIFRYIKG